MVRMRLRCAAGVTHVARGKSRRSEHGGAGPVERDGREGLGKYTCRWVRAYGQINSVAMDGKAQEGPTGGFGPIQCMCHLTG